VGNGRKRHVRNNGRAVGAVFRVWSVSKLYNEGQLPLTGLPPVYLGLIAKETCICGDRKEGCVLRKLQRGLSAIETWCECWNINVNEDKTQAVYFSHRLRPLRIILQ
jgi:hypothetical protein